MIKDRGTIKWASSFMFPEQIRLLKEMEEEDKKVPKPTLSEDEKLEINDLL